MSPMAWCQDQARDERANLGRLRGSGAALKEQSKGCANAKDVEALVNRALSDIAAADGKFDDAASRWVFDPRACDELSKGRELVSEASGLLAQADALVEQCFAGGGERPSGPGTPGGPPALPGREAGQTTADGKYVWDGTAWILKADWDKRQAQATQNIIVLVGVALFAVALMVVGFLLLRRRREA